MRLSQLRAFLLSFITSFLSQVSLASEDLTIFDITFDQPLSIRECPSAKKKMFGKERKYVHSKYSLKSPCYTRSNRELISTIEPLDRETVTVFFPLRQKPSISKRQDIWLRMVNNRVQRLSFSTRGWESQDEDFIALNEKFGHPERQTFPIVQNKLGAKFETISADWQLEGGISVRFNSIYNDSIDQGDVVIATPEGTEDYLQAGRKFQDQRVKL